jgi:diguanylate cyclase (GGDEF)-like protein
MSDKTQNRKEVFQRAWETINKDNSIPLEEKEGIMKLIQVLIEAVESFPRTRPQAEDAKTFTQEIVSKHSLLAMVKQQADELDALRRISLNLTSSLDLQTVLDSVISEAMRLIKNFRSAHIYLYTNGQFEFGASLNAQGVRNQSTSSPRQNGLTQSVADSKSQVIIEDVEDHSLFQSAKDWTGSIIGIPLKVGNDIVGVMNLSRFTKGNFTRSERRLLELLADEAAVAISNARMHKMVTELAYTDSITGLPNRRALDEKLQEEVRYAKRMKTLFSVVMMDLDGFKNVNDTHGHAVGDELLRALFNYFAANIRPTDFLARYGGDELTLVMRDTTQEEAELVTQKFIGLIRQFEFPFPNNKKVELGVTAGIAVYPIHTRTPGDLLRAADAALYQGKKHNRGSYVVAKGVTGPLPRITFMR